MNETTVTTPNELEIRVERVFDAPRAHVFAVWTDPKLIPEWWGDGTVVEEMDVCLGGEFERREVSAVGVLGLLAATASRKSRMWPLLQERRRWDSGLAADPVDEERYLVDVAPVPVLAGLERTDDRVRRGVGVRRRVPVG
jgi:hypothetical protein